MGVPSFYRWLVDKYPNVVVKAIEDKGECIDTSSENPNGIEFDNLYLDMNGLVHPCFHPEDDHPSPPTTFEDVFNNIFEYIDHIFSIVRPRKLLYMAIDGVAPRAKMNQQRSRRFRTAKDNEIAEAEEERLRRQFESEGKPVLPKQNSEVSDSNIITPGTEFMYKLSQALRSYIISRLNNDSGWKEIKVILSDANVPGEGEHKIMSFIRQNRNLAGYNPNTKHCLYGLDADLIMLALSTHELHFSILREDVLLQGQQPICQPAQDTAHWSSESSDSSSVNKNASMVKKPYQFLHVWILREYLELDLNISDPPENLKIDFERIVDDFIFICFFAGNDFLPHMPTLEIHEGCIDLLMTVYKREFKNLGGYLLDMHRNIEDKKAGYIKLSRVQKFILLVGTYEDKIFKKRSELKERKIKWLLSNQSNDQDDENEGGSLGHDTSNSSCALSIEKASISKGSADFSENQIAKNTKELKQKLKANLRKESDLFKTGDFMVDKIRLGTVGWKERYYKVKFSAENSGDIENIRKDLVQKYTEGLVWVLRYYFSGVPSWTWFYPYHYGPFASDFKDLARIRFNFQKGSPFKPFDQLLGVLPPKSVHALPKIYHPLVTDEQSSIVGYYPTDFQIDTEGKRFAWQGICKLPFIDEGRLQSETRELEKDLKEEEAVRNRREVDQLYVGRTHKLASQILSLSPKQNDQLITIDTRMSDGIGGFFRVHEETLAQQNCVICVFYELPIGSSHIPRLLEGVSCPYKTITEADIMETELWHEYQGNRPSNRLQQNQNSYRKANDSHFSSRSSQWPARDGYSHNVSHSSHHLANYRGTSTPNNNWRAVDTGKGELEGFKDLKISKSSQGYSNYGRGQSVNNTVWSQRNGANSQGNSAYGRSQSVNNNVWSQRNGANSQGYGRSQSVNNNVWSQRNGANSLGNSTYSRSQSVNNNVWSQRNGANSQGYSNNGRSQPVSNIWTQRIGANSMSWNHSSVNSGMSGRGRIQNVPSTSLNESNTPW